MLARGGVVKASSMSEFLKGTYPLPKRDQAKGESSQQGDEGAEPSLTEELRERALASICGSMVYVERTALSWDGDEAPGESADD